MSEFIEKLWYMCDNDNGIGGREDIMALNEDVRTAEGKLRESLSAEQCALFDKYIDEVYALMESGNKATFEMGLKFAMGFVFNTMGEDVLGKFRELVES